jgi:predicted nucleic acid-binding protein
VDRLPDMPLVTTWPCVAEAMYLLYRAGGHPAQEELWQLLEAGDVVIHASGASERERMRTLMARYLDTPMDLADASLVAAAEVLGLRRIFTLDSDFYAYRIGAGRRAGVFEVLP